MIFWYNIHGKAVPAAKNNCRRTCRKSAKGGKVPPPGARSTPFGVARRLVLAGIGWSAKPFTQCINKATPRFTRRTISAVSAANECEGITCLWQVTRNDSDEAERSERSPSGVVSVANDEELAAVGGQVSGKAAPASGNALQPDRPSPPARGAGGRARRPPEPSAGRRPGAHYPPGSWPVIVLKNCYPPGSWPVLDAMQSRI